MRKTLALLALVSLLTSPLMAYDVNIDFRNTSGITVHDIGLELEGDETITRHFDGYWNIRFQDYQETHAGSRTRLHWFNPVDMNTGQPTTIPPNAIVHVGYSTADRDSVLLDAYWTDLAGNRIPGAGIAVAKVDPLPGGVRFTNRLNRPITLSDLRYRVRSVPVLLDVLNLQNSELNSSLLPLPAPGAITLSPGQILHFSIPSATPGSAVIIRANVTSPNGGSSAFATQYVQGIVE